MLMVATLIGKAGLATIAITAAAAAPPLRRPQLTLPPLVRAQLMLRLPVQPLVQAAVQSIIRTARQRVRLAPLRSVGASLAMLRSWIETTTVSLASKLVTHIAEVG
jgi:hypothetical protein